VAPHADEHRQPSGHDGRRPRGQHAGGRAFHALTFVAALIGLTLLWAAVRKGAALAGRHLVGLMLAGWGAFNLVEGIVDHQILTVHHVNPDHVIFWHTPAADHRVRGAGSRRGRRPRELTGGKPWWFVCARARVAIARAVRPRGP
jgi:hypothetical protein